MSENMNGGGNTLAETEYDVVVVGAGASGLTAAMTAARGGASVIVLEVAEGIGGTTAKSSGGFWIPRNRLQLERAQTDDHFVDDRDGCLAHMARMAYPEKYDRGAERHGLDQHEWDHIVHYYDNAAEVIGDLESTDDITIMWLGSFRGDDLGLPSWFETEEDGNTYGRLLCVTAFDKDRGSAGFSLSAKRTGGSDEAMQSLGATFGDGVDLTLRLAASLRKYGGDVVCEHRVTDLVFDDEGGVTGVVADSPSGSVTVTARKAVIFGSGGLEHDKELREKYLRGPIVGSCGVETNRGDLVRIAERHDLSLGNMREAWWATLPLEPCLASTEQGELMNQLYGDATVGVSFEGKRVSNEKESYNERGKIHSYQAPDGSYPYRLLVQVLHGSVIDDPSEWPARWPVPVAPEIPEYVVKGDTLEELADALRARLDGLADQTDGFQLSDDFVPNLKATIERFNGFAETGVDEDFGRGNTWPQQYFSVQFRGEDEKPNFTMYPIADTGPYYALVYGASCLGSKGGPKITLDGQILRNDRTPVPGLFGAGNCIASPTGAAYWGGGSTLGPAIFNGYCAGRAAIGDPLTAASSYVSA